MRAIGKGSVSSFLAVLLTVCAYAVAFVLMLTTMLVVVSLFVDIPGLTMTLSPVPPGVNVDHSPRSGDLSGFTMSIPVSFSVNTAVTAPSLGIESAQIETIHGSLRFRTPSRAFFFGNAILLIVTLAFTLWMLGQLRAVFRTLRDGRPFVADNATRIRWIAFAVIAGEVARSAIVFVENSYAKAYFSGEGVRFDARWDINGFAIINGLIILVIAEVFRSGTSLDEEQSLTV